MAHGRVGRLLGGAFATHPPVPAGHAAFPFNLVETHLSGAWGTLGAYREDFLALGQYDNGSGPLFNLIALAMRTAGTENGGTQLYQAIGGRSKDYYIKKYPVETTSDRKTVKGEQ